MKRKLESYSFSKAEIEILIEVANENHSLSLLRKRLHIKPNLLSHDLRKLSQKGIIVFKKKGKLTFTKKGAARKHVYFADSKHASLLRDLLITNSHIQWEDILSGLGIEVLFQILNEYEVKFTNFSKVTFWRYSRDLMARGIVKLDDGHYVITPRFSVIAAFLTEFQHFLLNNFVKSISERATVLWEKDFECLIRVPKNANILPKTLLKTATSRLDDFGIQILSDFDIYFYSKRKKVIGIEDVILHTLLLEKSNVRYVTYSLLVLKNNMRSVDKEYLLKEAQRLGLGLQINAMFQFLKTKGKRGGMTLPTWPEFVSKAKEYMVTV
jgi:DNA-binding MarR family transcriptional regulator